MSRKRLGRTLLIVAAVLLFLAFLPLLVVAWPEPAFPHRLEHGRFTLRSERPIDPALATALDDVERRLRALEIDRPDERHRLFLCQTAGRYRFFAHLMRVSPHSQGVNAPLAHTIFLSQWFLDDMRSTYGARYRYALVEGDFAHLATHEIVHTLVERALGFSRARALPHWKREGYPEYAAVAAALAADRGDDLSRRYRRFLRLRQEGPGPVRTHYARSQLLVEYVMTKKGWSFDQLMASEVDEEALFQELTRWVEERPPAADVEAAAAGG